jgi:hypothetical protein
LFACFMEQALELTLVHLYHILPARVWWPQWCTLWSPLCWIPSSIAWEIGTLVMHWKDFIGA